MPKIIESGSGTLLTNAQQLAISRRRFLGYGGAAAALVIGVSACDKDDDNPNPPGGGIDLGSGDTGILNYAYALEQLEAAFYIQVIATPWASIDAGEKALLTDIRDHEIAHREFFKTALAGDAIQALEVDFSSIDFTNRTKVLEVARTFEDLGVSAYNGAGSLITNGAYLTLAGKIVSVEARHAALIRDLISNGTFADNSVVDPVTGLDKSNKPADVLAAANGFLKTKVSGSNLPTS